MTFWQPCRSLFTKGPKCFRSKYENENFIILQKLLSLNLFPWTHCIFDKLVKYFWKQLDKILQIKYQNDEKNGYFAKKIINTFLCRRKLRFWQHCWIVFARSPNKIRSKCGSRKNSFSFLKKNVSPQNVPQDSLHFHNPIVTFPSKVIRFFCA